MAVTLSKSQDEINQLPLVELAWEILRSKKEPFYFRDLMNEIQVLRSMTDEQVMDVIARLYTEINIDGRFICIGQNVWGLKRWYPVDKTAEKASSKRFVRSTGDAFSDDDEDLLDEDFEDDSAVEDEVEESPLYSLGDDGDNDEDDTDDDAEAEDFDESSEDDADFSEDSDDEDLAEDEDEELLEEDTSDDEDEDENL